MGHYPEGSEIGPGGPIRSPCDGPVDRIVCEILGSPNPFSAPPFEESFAAFSPIRNILPIRE
jgi:hypothetical protein